MTCWGDLLNKNRIADNLWEKKATMIKKASSDMALSYHPAFYIIKAPPFVLIIDPVKFLSFKQ